ncbi:hypothetical protein BX616_006655 [Lobosporangium transversale]|uniref:Uncharacterized protein n=1 Tax=Lobosporangium transversale TaxID=64571 RepID=A0A1Y2H271_9FUNG|nr:hypothetical protein BCR41DRAFT_343870 [Lobosporangium transversale]KAF9896843.1 hypothetical protein BX616_006655 [Lobosporangium transversale]ORZ28670.1 hypothetical protein BCR41DRAFT_343870 [Lobosporangium transversale]|eukprot:XP_021886343.1 hypothetical protein BCR41DRAFT_343870 [Lobosporangium transversale]
MVSFFTATAPGAARRRLLALAVFALALFSSIPTLVDAAKGETITLSFLDEAGAVISQQTIPWAECTNIDTTLLQPTGGAYASVSASVDHAALNLYSYPYCATLSGSAVGRWRNAGDLKDMIAIRWEGIANDLAPGTERTTNFPPEMAVATQGPDPDADPILWAPDPEKGKLVVGLVAGVLAVGVLIGVYQVYKAAQYVPPPKKPKKITLNTKKIKKKDAYYRKPAPARPVSSGEDDKRSFQRLEHNESPEPLLNRPQMMERGGGPFGGSSRDSQYSEAATFVDWGQQQQHQQHNPAVSIDMRETSYSNNNNNNNNNSIATRLSPFRDQHRPATAELIQFDGVQSSDNTSNHNNSNNRGRGGEVLVPMHTFENNNGYSNNNGYNGRSAYRRSSSSRSR